MSPNQSKTLPISGVAGVPAFDASIPAKAVVLHTTSVFPDHGGFLTLYPSGGEPNAADVNFFGGDVVGNMVVVKLKPADGTIQVTNDSTGFTDVVVDVEGWYS